MQPSASAFAAATACSGAVAFRLGTSRSEPASTLPSVFTVYRSWTLKVGRVLFSEALDFGHEINRTLLSSCDDRSAAVRVAQLIVHARSASRANLIDVGMDVSRMRPMSAGQDSSPEPDDHSIYRFIDLQTYIAPGREAFQPLRLKKIVLVWLRLATAGAGE
jgi:hypothetical protein